MMETPTREEAEPLVFRVIDLKQYTYCPRVA